MQAMSVEQKEHIATIKKIGSQMLTEADLTTVLKLLKKQFLQKLSWKNKLNLSLLIPEPDFRMTTLYYFRNTWLVSGYWYW
jgi:hypothetical protein